MRKQSWVPFPEVTEATEGQIAMGHTGMPVGLDQERLELNVGALRRGVISVGGYSALTLAAFAGDADQYGYSASSTDGSGTGTAAFGVTVQKAESASMDRQSERRMNRLNIRNGSLSVQWNSNALNQRLELHEQYDPAVRAPQLDKVIREQSVRGVLGHNTVGVFHDKSKFETLIDVGIDGYALSRLCDYIINENPEEIAYLLGGRLLILAAMSPVVKSLLFHVRFQDNIDDPFFFSGRPIKAVAGAGVLATSRLVRAVS